MTQPNLVLLPWARRGGSVTLPPDDPAGHPASQVSTTAEVIVNGAGPPASVAVQVLGPGDVTGLAPQQVIRTDPAAGARTFESNYFALVEFDEPALPWLFTPASAVAGRLRPWLCLVVVRQQPGVELAPPSRGALPVLRIGAPAHPEVELPDLKDSWAWAHAQLATDAAMSDAALSAALGGDPARSLSRLVSGRLLAEQTEYLACVVPTFEAGRRTGLGDDPGNAQGPAWQVTDDMGPVELPVLHSWRFATGPSGDFQSLALAIRGRVLPADFGVRPVDLSTSGLDIPAVDDAQVLLGGALLALDAPTQRWSDPTLPGRFAAALTTVLNAPDLAPAAEPLLAPPRYGSTYRSLPGLDQAAGRWYEQLNLDPANRVAAALGTLVIQQQQETLVAAAWDQAADLEVAQRLYGLAGFGLALADSLHRRYVLPLAAEAGLFVLAPLRARLLQAPATGADPSFGTQWAASLMPEAALGAAVRRVTRARGPAMRRASRVQPMPSRIDVLGKMAPASRIERVVVPPLGRLTFEEAGGLLPSPQDLSWSQVNPDAITNAGPRPLFALAPMPRPQGPPRPLPTPGLPGGGVVTPTLPGGGVFTPTPPGGVVITPTLPGGGVFTPSLPGGGVFTRPLMARRRPTDPDEPFPEDPELPEPEPEPEPDPHHPPRPDNQVAATFRVVAAAHLTAFLPTAAPGGTPVGVLDVQALFAEAKALTSPARTFTAHVAGMLTTPMPEPTDTPVPALQFTPRFDTPMVRALTELGQQWLLPGLDGVPANTAVALRTNGAFVESFLVGLNHEFARELLWREFPTPLTATFFERFWDAAVAPDSPPDIPPLDTWADRTLGAPTIVEERFVLLLRSELLRRFPDALVSAVRAGSPPEHLMPVFRGALEPDITFFGFTVPLADADEFSIVIAEQPGAPRFGLEVGEAPAGVSHAPAVGATSAQVAAHLRQLPARITIPVSVLLRKPAP